MWFSYLKFFLVEILPLEAKTYNCLTFHNLYQEGCLCQTLTSKRIKLEIPAWSGFEGLEKFFPTIMWFFYLEFFWVEIWLTLAEWSKSRITHNHHHPPSGELNWKGFLIVAVTFYAQFQLRKCICKMPFDAHKGENFCIYTEHSLLDTRK